MTRQSRTSPGFTATLEAIAIDKIRTDGGTQSRAAINDDVVAEYAEVITGGEDFPPVTVYFDGKAYWLSDGFHRTAAYRKAGAVEIQAEVRQGDKRAAVLHSVGVNARHGLRRTNSDKRRAIETLLRDDEWTAWSDAEIARRCFVSPHTVARCRNDIGLTMQKHSEKPTERTYTDKHGNTSTMKTENIGGNKPADTTKPDSTAEAAGETITPEPSAPARPKSPYAELTREALEDDLAAMHEDNAILQKQVAERDETIARLEAQIKDLSGTDQGATISKLNNQRIVLKGRLDDAMMATKREEYKRKRAEKERDEAIAKLENQVIPL